MDQLGMQTCQECGNVFHDVRNKRSKCSKCRRWYGKCPKCGGRMGSQSSQCGKCRNARSGPDSPTWKGGKTRHNKGYVMEMCLERKRYVMQHILVMEDSLGRRLLPGENVHHRNGVRDDNRIENLELWVKPQPTGVRTEDAVEWALEILRRYSPQSLGDE